MSKRWLNNFCAVCFVILFLTAMALMSGCTVYKVKSTSPDGKQITVSVYSGRNFEAPDLHYGKDEMGVQFDFKAATAVDGNQAILNAILSGALVVPK